MLLRMWCAYAGTALCPRLYKSLRTLDFQLFDKVIDAEGRYVFFLCIRFQLTCILAAIYIPPPYNSVLRILLTYQLGNPDDTLILVGDLNCFLDPVLDRHPPIPWGFIILDPPY